MAFVNPPARVRQFPGKMGKMGSGQPISFVIN